LAKSVRSTAILALLFALSIRAADTSNPQPDPDGSESESESPGIEWRPLLWQSFFFASIENGFRVATQDYTRRALRGPFFHDWLQSVGNLHGWADGDPFLINYVGHPMQGAVAGYIFVQNDPAYRNAVFGRNRHYWKSRARATLFSFAYSEQFEIGPYSEASIGNTQAWFPQQGFVDHVITPTVGLGWMITEDALDRYLIERLEARTSNTWIKMFLRAGLNPSRSMANAMRLEVPWHRDTRPGIFHDHPPVMALRTDNESVPDDADDPPPLSDLVSAPVPRFELQPSYSYFRLGLGKSGATSCHGGGASATYNFTGWLGLTADVSGCKMSLPERNLSGDITTYMLGPRFAFRAANRWIPFVQFLAGGTKLAFEREYPDRKPDIKPPYPGEPNPLHSLYTSQFQTNAFAIQTGVGLDYLFNRVVALHAIDLEDVHTWARTIDGTHYPNNLRLSTGVTLRFGGW
jgi:hypothetical protein